MLEERLVSDNAKRSRDESDKQASTEEKFELRLRMLVNERVNGSFLTALCLLIIVGIIIKMLLD